MILNFFDTLLFSIRYQFFVLHRVLVPIPCNKNTLRKALIVMF